MVRLNSFNDAHIMECLHQPGMIPFIFNGTYSLFRALKKSTRPVYQ